MKNLKIPTSRRREKVDQYLRKKLANHRHHQHLVVVIEKVSRWNAAGTKRKADEIIGSEEGVETGDDVHLILKTIKLTIENIMRGSEVDLTKSIVVEDTQTLIPIQDVIIIRRKSRVRSTQKAARSFHPIFINHPMTSESISENTNEANIIVIDLNFNIFYFHHLKF